MAEERKQPLSSCSSRELGVDEVALIGRAAQADPRAAARSGRHPGRSPRRCASSTRDVCARLRVLPLALAIDGRDQGAARRDGRPDRHLGDPRARAPDAAARSRSTALPLSAIDELVDKGYKQFSTAVSSQLAATPVRHRQAPTVVPIEGRRQAEVSVTAQIPLASLREPDARGHGSTRCARCSSSKGRDHRGRAGRGAGKKLKSNPDSTGAYVVNIRALRESPGAEV